MNTKYITSVPKHWIIAKFGDVIDVKGGSQPPKSEFIYEPREGYVRLLQIRDFGDKPVPTYVPVNRVTKFCDKDDILIARYGASLGRIVKGMAGAYNVALAKVIVDPKLLEKRYLFYLLQTPILQTPLRMISRSAQNGFAKHELAHIDVPIPPLNEQRRIVARIEALFSELDAGVAALKRARAQLKRYRQALLKAAFEGRLTADWRRSHAAELEPADVLLARIRAERERRWQEQLAAWEADVRAWEAAGKPGRKPKKLRKPKALPPLTEEELAGLPELPEGWAWVQLGVIAEILGGVTKGRKFDGKATIKLPYLRVANVQDGYLDLSVVKEIEVLPEDLEKYRLLPGDILYTEGGDKDKLGRGTIWEGQIENCIHQNHVFRARVSGTFFDSKYVAYFSQTQTAKRYFFKRGKQTTNLASINMTVLSGLPLPLISKQEQEEIISKLELYLSTVDYLDQTIEQTLARAAALRQAILQRAFRGRLVPQNPEDEPAGELLD